MFKGIFIKYFKALFKHSPGVMRSTLEVLVTNLNALYMS
jgi:hypothetical protein